MSETRIGTIGAVICWYGGDWRKGIWAAPRADALKRFAEAWPESVAAIPKLSKASGDTVTGRDLSTILTTLAQGSMKHLFLGGFPIREGGGVYFVPAQTFRHIGALKEAIDSLGDGFQFHVLELGSSKANLLQIEGQSVAWLNDCLDEVEHEARKFEIALKAEGKKPDDRNIAVRLKRFDLAIERIGLYRDILGQVSVLLTNEASNARDNCRLRLEGMR